MNIAIIHFHLNRGGVTQVIMNHVKALDAAVTPADNVQVAILYGGRKSGWPDDLAAELTACRLRLEVVEGLEYDEGVDVDDGLTASLQAALARQGFTADDTVLHIHNHGLGKNVSLPLAIRRLAEQGFPLLLQVHDFAEDFRGGNYQRLQQALVPRAADNLAAALYPQGARIHYATLTAKDFAILSDAGCAAERLHLLPNPVNSPGTLPDREPARQSLVERFGFSPHCELLLYPVRAIRRKNLGEALLWSAVAASSHRVAVTLSPLNPVERPTYERWRQVARRLALPFLFGTGESQGLSFLENLAAADKILTTSVAEGFGMVFLESWLVGRPLIGRDLTSVTQDFSAAGVRFDRLQPQLAIPLNWIDAPRCRAHLLELFRAVWADFGRDVAAESSRTRDQVDELMAGGHIDFAYLTAADQQLVIATVTEDQRRAARLLEANPVMSEALRWSPAEYLPVVESNARVIEDNYSLAASGPKLCALYQTVSSGGGDKVRLPDIDADAILNAFLDIRRLYPLRMDDDSI